MKLGLAIAVLASACDKGDDCQRFVDKMLPVASNAGKPMPANAKEQFLKECRGGGTMKKDPMFKCVLDAKDDTAVASCMSSAFGDYAKRSRKTEAQLNLNKLGKNLKVYYITESKFPAGKVGLTPADACCKALDQKCAANAEQWSTNATWSVLDFQIDEPAQFQYSYDSDGTSATATAVGDLDCDGTTITYKLEVTVENGAAVTKIVPPTNED